MDYLALAPGEVSPVYRTTFRIRSEHSDETRRLRLSALLRILQEVSITHTEALGVPRTRTLDRGYNWVIAQQHIEIDELPSYDDEVTLISMPCKMMHIFYPRYFEIQRNGIPLIRAEAIWLLIDAKSRIAAFPEKTGVRIDPAPDAPDGKLRPHLAPGDDTATDVLSASFTAAYHEIDLNGHMNNTTYFDRIDDLLTEHYGDPALLHPKSIDAEYIHEIRRGDRIKIEGSCRTESPSSDLRWFFEGSPEQGGTPLFRIASVYAPIIR